VKSIYLILFLALSATPACSRFTARERQDRAYAKYIRKSKSDHERRQTQLRHDQAKVPQPDGTMPSEPRETTQTSENQQAIPIDPENQ
jgi:hypothetical protein